MTKNEIVSVLFGVAIGVLILVGVYFVGLAFYDHSNCPIKDYQEVEDWVDEYPEMRPMFHEFTWEDKHMQNWEYWALHKKFKDLEALEKIQDIETNEQDQYEDKAPGQLE